MWQGEMNLGKGSHYATLGIIPQEIFTSSEYQLPKSHIGLLY